MDESEFFEFLEYRLCDELPLLGRRELSFIEREVVPLMPLPAPSTESIAAGAAPEPR